MKKYQKTFTAILATLLFTVLLTTGSAANGRSNDTTTGLRSGMISEIGIDSFASMGAPAQTWYTVRPIAGPNGTHSGSNTFTVHSYHPTRSHRGRLQATRINHIVIVYTEWTSFDRMISNSTSAAATSAITTSQETR